MNLIDLDERLSRWHRDKFGGKPINRGRTITKLGEEFGELCRAALEGDENGVAEEAADMVFILAHLIRSTGLSLGATLEAKLCIIEMRLSDPMFGRKG